MASQQGETMSGPLHIGLIPTVGPYLLPHIIPMLHQTFPKLEMYLHEAQTHQLLAQLDSGKLDCVILALVKESEAFIEVPLFDEPMLLAIYEDHPWANRECVPMADLAGEKLLMLEDGHCLRDQAMGFSFEAGADEDTHFRATSLETLRNMVAAGSGITLLPALAVPPERKRDGVVYLPCIKPEPRRTIGLVYRPGSPLRSRYEQLAEAICARMDGHFDKVLKQAVEFGGSGGGGSGGGGSGGGGSGGGGSGGGGSGGELSCAISRLSSPVVSERMYPEDGALKSEIKKGLRLKDGGHYAAEVKTTYKAKKPVQLPGAYIVDIKMDIVSHNEDYTIVEQYERAEGRHSTGGMDELYKGGTGGSLVSKGEEDNMAIIKEFMRFKVHMEGSVNGHEFEIEGEGEGRPYEAFQTAKLKVTKGGPLPFAWDILSPQFMYGSKAYIKHPADIPDYFKLSFPEGFRWERVMNFEEGGIIHVNQDSSLQDGVFIYKVKLRGTNFPPDGPVMQKKTMGWEYTRDQRCSSQA
nr:red fluorescent protein based redox biosensor PerxRFP1 [synthetic construct]